MKCDKCDGTGELPDQRAIGAAMRLIRKKQRVSLRAVAEVLGYKPPYISDLELGRRNWNLELRIRYLKAVKQA